MAVVIARRNRSASLAGRVFVHPLYDYMLIGGGLSVVVTAIVATKAGARILLDPKLLPFLFFFSNSAHFAASTVRLYTKPDAYRTLPFVTMALPLVTLFLLTLCVFQAGRLGPHVQSLYLTWSPYHYAAQAYGLAVMYSYRSGCLLKPGQKSWLWRVSMLPFLYTFLRSPGVGLDWLVPEQLLSQPLVQQARYVLGVVLIVLAFVTPIWLYVRIWRAEDTPMPLIAPLLLFNNGIWFFIMTPINAFAWATIFHGIQYLAIVIVFHLKDQMARPDTKRGPLFHIVWFYGMSLALGYGLFNAFPLAYIWAGFGRVESMILTVATINIHHFIVDGFIWRLKKTDGNRRIVDSLGPVPTVTATAT